MRTISQRELRNDNAEIVRDVETGESFTVTRRGVPVARLVPLLEPEAQADLRCDRPAKKRPTYSSQLRVGAIRSVADLLDDLRGER